MDNTITIGEMKFNAKEFSISADCAKIMRNKLNGFSQVTNSKKKGQIAFISTYGLKF